MEMILFISEFTSNVRHQYLSFFVAPFENSGEKGEREGFDTGAHVLKLEHAEFLEPGVFGPCADWDLSYLLVLMEKTSRSEQTL
jgi:hypothetical protein